MKPSSDKWKREDFEELMRQISEDQENPAARLVESLAVSRGCPVCSGFGKDKVAESIINIVRRTGSFSPGGVASFWRQFGDALCDSCQHELDALEEKKPAALRLLEEAVKLDPKNEAAKKNLEALKKMEF